MSNDILSAVSVLFQPGQVVEVRAIGEYNTASEYFDDPVQLAEKAALLNKDTAIQGIYVTLNRINPVLLARRANRIKAKLGKKDASTADSDIIHRDWLPIDIDPIRPSGVSSSEEEHAAALAKAEKIATYLTEMGWPTPVMGDSGNGAHLLYRIDLPNDLAAKDLVKGCLESLSILFSDDRCQVDTANFNAARIWKLYGTISRKGDNTPDRPHRKSCLISTPEEIEIVSEELLQHLAGLFPKEIEPPNRTKTGQAIDLAHWLSSHGIGYEERPYQGGSLFVFDECPFSGDHKDGAYAIQFPNGAIFAGCHHNSCGGGAQRWTELRERYDGKPTRKRQISSRDGNQVSKREQKKQILEAAKTSPVPEITEEAGTILREGDPLTFILDTFNQEHEGDRVVAECMAMSLASRSVINSKGLHVSITGESGKGKSHTIDTMLQFIPPAYRIDGRMSDKALFYIDNMKPGTVIALDDVFLSDQMQEILKGVTTSFQKDFMYHTVSKDRTGQVCIIPERCVWWVAKVEGAGDDQVFNRMLTCWIDDSEEQDQKVLTRSLAEAEKIPDTKPKTRQEILIAQEMWLLLKPVWVVIPFASRIRFQNATNRRNPDMLLDLIKTQAALRQYQRESGEVDGMRYIVATREDFTEAARLFQALNGETGGQITKLTRKEAELIESIKALNLQEMTITQLQKATGWTNSTINKLFHGYQSRGQSYTGLLEKCPAISFLDRTVSTGDDGVNTQRRAKVFTWDIYLYESWAQGCSVWVEGDNFNSDNSPDAGDDPGGRAVENRTYGERAGASAQIRDEDKAENDKEDVNYLDQNKRAETDERSELTDSSGLRSSDASHDLRSSALSSEPGAVQHCSPEWKTNIREEVPAQTGPPSALPPDDPEHIPMKLAEVKIEEFISVEGWPNRKPCSVCGKGHTYYQERMTRERLRQPPRPNRMLCKNCYDRAKRRVSNQFTTIPGTIDTSVMVRTGTDLGRCHVCDTSRIIWWDAEQHLGLCDQCYEREVQTTENRGIQEE